MSDKRLLAAVGGFAFVAAWIGFSLGEALLCLLGAAVFWALAGILEGKVDLGELQQRFAPDDGPPTPQSSPIPPAPAAAPRARPRVQ